MVLSWTFCIVSLIYISLSVPVPYYLDYCSPVLESEARENDSFNSNFFFFFFCFKIALLFEVFCVSIEIGNFFSSFVEKAIDNLIGFALNL